MAWAIHREWSANDAMRIRRDLARVATTIARFEPIRLLAPPGRAYCEARERFSDYPAVTVVKAPVDDFWMRDVMPTFAKVVGGRSLPSIGTSTAGAIHPIDELDVVTV
jgi:agmatine deiminase